MDGNPSRKRPGRSLGHLDIAHWPVDVLRAELDKHEIALNSNAERLLACDEMLLDTPLTIALVSITVAELGLSRGATLPDVLDAAVSQGLHLCPLATGPYLRLAHREQESSDPELGRQRPPQGALHVASVILSADVDMPKGFYLRTVEGKLWLRGYRCDDEYVIAPGTTYVFSTSDWALPTDRALRADSGMRALAAAGDAPSNVASAIWAASRQANSTACPGRRAR